MKQRNQKLLDWLKAATDESVKKTGTTRSYLQAIGYGYKTAGARVAVSIEEITEGSVTRSDLRDDWAVVWPELALKKTAA